MGILKRPWTLLDIFSGSGGLSLGLKMSGFFEPVASIEYDRCAAMTYKTNFPTSHVFENRVEKISGKEIIEAIKSRGFEKIDAICGGPPCRPFSMANKGDTQWKVIKKVRRISNHPDWMNFLRLIKELDPICVIAENVMGFRSNREVYSTFVRRLESSGYTVSPVLLNASKFGIPQTRERIIIIAIKGNFDKNKLIPSGRDGKIHNVQDAIQDLPSLSNENNGSEVSRYSNRVPSKYARELRGNQKILFNHVAHSVHPVMQKRFRYIPPGHNLKTAWESGKIPLKILQSPYVQRGRLRRYTVQALNNIHSNIYRKLRWDSPCPTITHPRKTVTIHPTQNRLLSVRECARLQSFPDHFMFRGSISQQYQQVADAVPPLLAQSIGKKIHEVCYADIREPKLIMSSVR